MGRYSRPTYIFHFTYLCILHNIDSAQHSEYALVSRSKTLFAGAKWTTKNPFRPFHFSSDKRRSRHSLSRQIPIQSHIPMPLNKKHFWMEITIRNPNSTTRGESLPVGAVKPSFRFCCVSDKRNIQGAGRQDELQLSAESIDSSGTRFHFGQSLILYLPGYLDKGVELED